MRTASQIATFGIRGYHHTAEFLDCLVKFTRVLFSLEISKIHDKLYLGGTHCKVESLITKSMYAGDIQAFLQGLRLTKLVVHSFSLKQANVSALFNNSSLIQHKDPICIFDSRKPMSNSDGGTTC